MNRTVLVLVYNIRWRLDFLSTLSQRFHLCYSTAWPALYTAGSGFAFDFLKEAGGWGPSSRSSLFFGQRGRRVWGSDGENYAPSHAPVIQCCFTRSLWLRYPRLHGHFTLFWVGLEVSAQSDSKNGPSLGQIRLGFKSGLIRVHPRENTVPAQVISHTGILFKYIFHLK